MAALTQACRVSSKRPHTPVSLSTYHDIICNKFYFDCILTILRNNCPRVLTVYGKGHVFADEEPMGKKKRKIYAKVLHKFDWGIEYYCGQTPLWDTLIDN